MYTLYLLIVSHFFNFICVHYADWTKWRSAFFLDNFQQLLPKEVRNKKPMVQLLTKIVLAFVCIIKSLGFNFSQKLSYRFFLFAKNILLFVVVVRSETAILKYRISKAWRLPMAHSGRKRRKTFLHCRKGHLLCGKEICK